MRDRKQGQVDELFFLSVPVFYLNLYLGLGLDFSLTLSELI